MKKTEILFSVTFSDRTRGIVHKLKHTKFNLNMKKQSYSESGPTLEKVDQRGSILGDIQNLIEHSPRQPGLSGHA